MPDAHIATIFSSQTCDTTKEKGVSESMAMRTGQLWECRNSTCGCEVLVVCKSRVKDRTEPRCCCGSMMKKAHALRGRRESSAPYRGNFPGSIQTSKRMAGS